MARNNTLANVLLMLKGELGYALTPGVATAQDQELYTLIDNKQRWLSSDWSWPFLEKRSDIAVAGGIGSRYQTAPTDINFERPVNVQTLWNTFWRPVIYGIEMPEYNALSSGDGGVPIKQLDPIQRWRWNSETQIEIWPLPNQAQTLRFIGDRPLTSLKTAGVYDPATTLDLDDLMIVLYVAAEKLALMKKANAELKLTMAETHANRVKASYASKRRNVVLGGGLTPPPRKLVPMIVLAS